MEEAFTPEFIYVQAHYLRKVLWERVKQLEELRLSLAKTIAEKLHKEDADKTALSAALLMIGLEDGDSLSAEALSIESYVSRAAEVKREHRELSRFARSLTGMPDTTPFALTWEEASRFGV